MFNQRITLTLLAIASFTMLGASTAEAQRNIFRDVIREGANQILNNPQGVAPGQPPTSDQPKTMRSLAPSESGRDSGGAGFDRTDGGGGWIPVQPGTQTQPFPPQTQPQPYQPQPYQTQPYPSQLYQQPYQVQPYPADPQYSQSYSEPPLLVEPGNGEPLKISVPKSEDGSISYTLITPTREIPLSLNPGYSQNLKETSALKVRYNGSRGTTTYRIRGGKKYVFKQVNGSFWDLFTADSNVTEPPALSNL